MTPGFPVWCLHAKTKGNWGNGSGEWCPCYRWEIPFADNEHTETECSQPAIFFFFCLFLLCGWFHILG